VTREIAGNMRSMNAVAIERVIPANAGIQRLSMAPAKAGIQRLSAAPAKAGIQRLLVSDPATFE
jgi:hypothetical protein